MRLSTSGIELTHVTCALIGNSARPSLGDIHLMFRNEDYTYTHLYLTRQEASNLAIAIADAIVQLDEEACHAAD